MKNKKQKILILTAGLILLATQIKPLLNSSLISEELRKKINANVVILTNQINELLTSAASTLAETYASAKIGGGTNKTALLSKLSMILLMARIGIARLCLILLTLSSIHVLANNETFISQIENIEQYVFDKPIISKVISQYPKTMDQLMEFAKIYWDLSEKIVNAISAIFNAVMNPNQSGVTEILKTVENVVKTIKDMKVLENLDLPKL
eukprot:CAMPEP_0201582988 /NCGR_PEP_ID=MMETSP0190_2-20130828/93045_1 /ASSEMBLY_ACC=CAM_ASM_000263 /TAXON_ID=37353 /ORGANISM="Rosalina sp." /LENGTH=208 /DNA_ID=CAMNT_0048024031 /DNA_START=25 /DNA_END=647 /DNA_ORIENTATION=+